MLKGAPKFGFCKPNERCYTAEEEKWCSGRLCISLEFIYPNWKKKITKKTQKNTTKRVERVAKEKI